MRQISTRLFTAIFLFMGYAVFTYAQITPEETDSVAIDSADWEQDVMLSETVIVGKGVIDLEEDRKTPVAVSTIKKQEIQDKAVGNVEFPEIMKNTPSVYVASQAGGFGDGQMYLRGFNQSNTAFLLNGQPINGMEDGNMYWSNWSAMSDVANAIQVQRGLGSSKLAISSVGGTVNIVTKATEKQQGGMARFVMGNDSYMKGTISYDTGLNNKWGFSILLDYWTAHRKYAYGTAGEGQSYFISVGYKPNDHHNLNFMIFGAPQWHDQNYATKSQSQWDAGVQYGKKYNTTYGYNNGTGENLRTNYYHKPVANLNWDWTMNEKASLSTVVYASLGRGGGVSGVGAANSITMNGLINYDEIYNVNAADPDGIGNNGGQYQPGNPYYNPAEGANNNVRSAARRSSVNNHFWYGAVTNFNFDTKTNWIFNLGADVRFYKGDHFQQMVDLYGLNGWAEKNPATGEYVVVHDTFDTNPWSALFDYADTDQRTARDNSETINYQGVFGQVEYNIGGFTVFAQGAFSNQFYQKFNTWNYGGVEAKSEKVNKTGYNVKGGMSYNFIENHTVFANAGRYSRQPYLDNIFVFNTVDLQQPEVDNEEITGYEVGYNYKSRALNINVNLYRTEWANRFFSTTGQETIDGVDTDITTRFTDITQVHKGVEVDVDAKLARKWTVRGYGSIGDWQYDGTTPYEKRNFDTDELLEDGKLDLTGTKIGNAAQFTFGLGTQFEVVKGLSIDADLNYYARLYGDVVVGEVIESAQNGEVYQSQEIAPYALVDAGLTYEFKFGAQKIRFRGNVKNLSNTQYIIAADGFGYGWGLGRTFNAGIQYNF